jgi:hypothetical protein
MKVIPIQDNNNLTRKVHCFLCGTISENDGEINECNHLVFVSCNEMDEPIYDKNDLFNSYEENNSDEDVIGYLLEELSNDYVCISMCEPEPGQSTLYFIYKF